MASGKKVFELFRRKGWQSIITERLGNFVLAYLTFIVSILAGVTALLVESLVTLRNPDENYESYVYGPMPNWRVMCFCKSMAIGFVASSIMMRVIEGSMNTLIVCWAEHPSQIEANHPELSKELIIAWSEAFPDSFFHFSANQATLVAEA